jgi:hypothetical protein
MTAPLTRRAAPVVLIVAGLVGLAAAAPARAAGGANPAAAARPAAVVALDEWSWQGFIKFWKRQLGRTHGVVGVVLLVAAGAALLILSKGRGT